MKNLIAMQKHIDALRQQAEVEATANPTLLLPIITLAATISILLSAVIIGFAENRIHERYAHQIAVEQDRTADAEDRVKGTMEAWNFTLKELQECKSR